MVGSRAAFGRTALTPDDVLLLAAGLHNISGLGNLLNAVLSGGSCVAAPGLDPAAVGDWLDEARPTWTFLTPTHLRVILEAAEGMGREVIAGDRSRLRLVRAGDAAVAGANAAAGGADAGRADPGDVRHERGAFHHRVGFGRR